MKKQTMSLAVASALLIGGTTAFGEMHINGQGTGEALVYPFYSAANGNDTYIHIVNTSSYTKAVKVRFVDALNSQEVLDFNLYLSPEDVWAGAITTNPNSGATGGAIVTVDNSCTVPALGSSGGANVGEFAGTTTTVNGKTRRMQPFVNFAFASTDTNRTPARTLQGYVEVIEMGQLDPTSGLGAAAVHGANGVPANCGSLVAAWNRANPVGIWESTDGASELLTTWMGGGLYGLGVVINVNNGTASGYDAVAVDDFALPGLDAGDLHQRPGSNKPDFADASTSITVFNGADATDYDFDNGQDAFSALFMTTSAQNDYVIEEGINALTDWVITMPTKKFYVQGSPADAPFSSAWNGATMTACEPVAISQWDREEAFTAPTPEGPEFSPQPPVPQSPDLIICSEVSVITFGEESALKANADIRYGFDPGYESGWASLDLSGASLNGPALDETRVITASDGTSFSGLPVTGFAVFSLQNGTLENNSVLSNYAAESVHKVTTVTSTSSAL